MKLENGYYTITRLDTEYTLRADVVDYVRKQTVFTIECIPENEAVRGNACAYDDEAENRRVEDEILEQLSNGNDWAWCTIKVSAEASGFIGVDYLGCCSYKSFEDFQRGGYFADMHDRAFEDMLVEILQTKHRVAKILTVKPCTPSRS